MKRLSVVLIVFASLLVLVNVASATIKLDVDATAGPGGNCSMATKTVFDRITDAVECARDIRAVSTDDIVILVKQGSYNNETLPIILDVSGLKVIGSTVLLDDRGIPTGQLDEQTKTEIVPTNNTTPWIFKIIADRVTLAGFFIDGAAIKNEMIFIDGSGSTNGSIRDFVVSGNYFINNTGMLTRLASGQVTGNYFMPGAGRLGALLTGGHVDDPAIITVDHNRATGDSNGNTRFGMVISGSMSSLLNLVEPIPPIPSTDGKAMVEVFENDFSNFPNKGTGIKFTVNYQGGDMNQQVFLDAFVHDNTFNHNSRYGLAVDDEKPSSESSVNGTCEKNRPTTFTGTFARNNLLGNGRSGSFFTFTQVNAAVNPILGRCYFTGSSVEVNAADDEFTGFNYDNPQADPVDHSVLGNVLTVNGVPIEGTKITQCPSGNTPCN